MPTLRILAAGLLALLPLSKALAGPNLLVNPGFADGSCSLAGWTTAGDPALMATGTLAGVSPPAGETCQVASAAYDPSVPSVLFQDVPTAIGQAYQASVWFAQPAPDGPSLAEASFGSWDLRLDNPGVFDYAQFASPVITATSSTTRFELRLASQNSGMFAGAPVVTEVAVNTPEPAALSLLCLALAGLAVARRWRRTT